ncbi:hypothetical protein F4823DRAFT_563718 [Ustulina deusta]|nr:hypothetical protein F4823DRAFT_563718 [Ustulina deusta]
MVQITTFALAVLASAGIVAAKSDYINKIITNLRANNEPTDDQHIQQGLWTCLDHGDISFKEYCSLGCNGGDKNDDYCNGSPEQVAEDAAEAAELAAEARKFRPRRGAPLDAKA